MKTTKLPKVIYALAITTILANCSTHPDKISAQYISPMQYKSYTCQQIASEMQMVSARVSEVGGKQEKASKGDSVKMGVGIILFWPTLFFLDNNSTQAAEYGRLKGEFTALEQAAVQKDCGIEIKAAVNPPLKKEAEVTTKK